MLQNGQNQVVLGLEVRVQGHLGDVGLGNDAVDTYGPNTFLVEQPVGCLQDPLPCRQRFWLVFVP